MPRVATRPWVLAVPPIGAALCHAGPKVIASLVRAFVGALFGALRRANSTGDRATLRCAAVSVVLPMDAALEPGLQIHVLAADGVFAPEFRLPRHALEVQSVARRARASLRETWGAHGWGPMRRWVPRPTGALRRVLAPPEAAPDVWGPWEKGSSGGVVVAAGARLAADRRPLLFEWAHAVGRPVLDPARASCRPDGWVAFEPPPVLDAAAAAVGGRGRLLRVELSPQAAAARFVDPGCPGRRIRFHGVLAAGDRARDTVLPRQLALGDEPSRVIRPRPLGRRPPAFAVPPPAPAPPQRAGPMPETHEEPAIDGLLAQDERG